MPIRAELVTAYSFIQLKRRKVSESVLGADRLIDTRQQTAEINWRKSTASRVGVNSRLVYCRLVDRVLTSTRRNLHQCLRLN